MTEEVWKSQLPDYAISIISHFSPNEPGSDWEQAFLERLITGDFGKIHTRAGVQHQASALMFDLSDSKTGRGRILEAISQRFPDQPHFLAQYARFLYDDEVNYSKARQLLEAAISLAPNDSLLYHMMGTSYRRELHDLVYSSTPAQRSADLDNYIKKTVDRAGEYFEKSRKLQRDNEYAYISHVECLIEAIDDVLRLFPKNTPRAQIIQTNHDIRRWLNEINDVLSEAESVFPKPWLKRENEDEARCIGDLPLLVDSRRGDISKVIEICQNLLDVNKQRGKTTLPDVSFLLANSLYTRASSIQKDDIKSQRDFKRSCEILEDLIHEHPGEPRYLTLWFRCARRISQSNRLVIQRLETLYSLTHGLDAAFYLMCMHFIRGLSEGSIEAFREYRKYRDISSKLAETSLAGRLFFREWIGPNNSLIPASLVPRNESTGEFDVSGLYRVEGRIEEIDPPRHGRLSIQRYGEQNIYGQQDIRFSPWRRGHKFYRSNKGDLVTFVVVFTYEEPEAYAVSPQVIDK